MFTYIFIYFIIIFLMMFRRFYIYYLNKNCNYGEDSGLIDWAKYYKKPFYFCLKFVLNDKFNTDTYWNTVKDKLLLIINKKKYNIKYDFDKNKLTEAKINDINEICFSKNINIKNFCKMKELHNNNPIIVNKLNNEYTFLFDHLVYDGLNAYNDILSYLFDFKKMGVRKNVYIPFIYENIIIFRFIEILYNNFIFKRTLISSNKSKQSVIYHNYDINVIKRYKNEYNLKFIDVALAFYCKKVFDSLLKKKKR